MKSILSTLALALIAAVPIAATAHVNPAVQPIFFEHLQAAMPQSQPAPAPVDGAVNEVTLAGLAWAVAHVDSDGQPLLIEFYSSNTSLCQVPPSNPNTDECTLQEPASEQAAAQYAGRVKFLRIDVSQYPVLLNGPDVRALPGLIAISQYTDTTHYTASKVGGYKSAADLQGLVKEDFSIDP